MKDGMGLYTVKNNMAEDRKEMLSSGEGGA
jgi:hypothetical protein